MKKIKIFVSSLLVISAMFILASQPNNQQQQVFKNVKLASGERVTLVVSSNKNSDNSASLSNTKKVLPKK